ncbi:MAG: phosphatidate cytidylyltransferase [Gammaproteobacteria bacterium]|nr:phosphatidate cytidylyltransferase [Gammaproteobacteria bacterium]
MSNLTLRIITAVIFAAVVLAVLLLLPGWPTLLFFTALLLIGVWEWSGFLKSGLLLRLVFVGSAIALGTAVLGSEVYWAGFFSPAAWLQAAMVWWLVIGVILYAVPIRYSAVFVALAGLLCLLPAWLGLLGLFDGSDGPRLFVWLVCIVAAADIGAYFSGKRFGRRKLAPALSPGKTLEGLLGGLLAATLVACAGSALAGLPVWPALLWGPLVAAVSVVGDLTVSAFKRNAGLKDTGTVLPGHGGILDRIDSLLAAAPFFVVILSFLRL